MTALEQLRTALTRIREAVCADYPAPVKLSEIDDIAEEALEKTEQAPFTSNPVRRYTDGGPDGWMQSPTGEFVRYDDIKHLLQGETECVGCAQGWHRQNDYPNSAKHVHCPPRFIPCTSVKSNGDQS